MIKRILAIGVTLLMSYISVVIGKLHEHPVLMWAGVGLAGIVVLGILVWLFKLLCKFIARSLASMVYVTSALVIVGLLSWHGKINPFVGFALGLSLGAILLWLVFRKLGGWAQSSILIGEIFAFVSDYKIRSYLNKEGKENIVSSDVKVIYNLDYKNIVLVLKQQMGYPTQIAKEAATYAIAQTQLDTPLQDKITEALKYLDDHKYSNN